MLINLSGHHVELTDALKGYVDEKFERITRHNDQINSVQVILSIDNISHCAEGRVRISGAELFAKAEAEDDMYAAIDSLVDKLDRQLKDHKDKALARKQHTR
ncbi:MAG: ribosome-associated translation inhibitor RaiA [Gammaproteobacteria bacterium]